MNSNPHTISVIIPTLNEAGNLGALLSQLRILDVAQIIVSDGGSVDRTRNVARAFSGVTVLSGPSGRGAQIARATPFITGDIVWLLHADSSVCGDPITEIRETLIDQSVALGCFRLRFDASGACYRLYERVSRIESLWTTFGDQGFFMRRDDYLHLGGCPATPLFEDVALRAAARELGAVRKLRTPIITSARRFRRRGPIRTQLTNARLLISYLSGADPTVLALKYYGAPDQRRRVHGGEAIFAQRSLKRL